MQINNDSDFPRNDKISGNKNKLKSRSLKEQNKTVQENSLNILDAYGRAQIGKVNFKGSISNAKNELYNKLLSLKSQNDIPLYSKDIIENIMHYVNDGTEDFAFELLSTNNTEGGQLYNLAGLSAILSNTNTLNLSISSKLISEKNNKGQQKYSSFDIVDILKRINDENVDFASLLLNAKDENGNNYLKVKDIKQILENTSVDNKDIVLYMLSLKDEDSKLLYNSFEIPIIQKAVTRENQSSVIELLSAKNEFSEPRFNVFDIVKIAENITDINRDILTKLLDIKDTEEQQWYNVNDIVSILGCLTAENKDFINKLIFSEDAMGNPRFSGQEIADIIRVRTDENKNFIDELISVADTEGNFIYDGNDIDTILSLRTSENKDFITKLIRLKNDNNNPRLMGFEFEDIINSANKENSDYILELLSLKDKNGSYKLTGYCVKEIVNNINDENRELINDIVFDKDNFDFNNDDIINIIDYINNKGIKETQKLYSYLKSGEITAEAVKTVISSGEKITEKDILKLKQKIGKELFESLNKNEMMLGCRFSDLYNKENINEISLYKKKSLLRNIVEYNCALFEVSERMKEKFPLIPANQEEYCEILPLLVKSMGVETKQLNSEEIKTADTAVENLASNLKNMSDEEFNSLTISQDYDKSEFIKDVFEELKDLPLNERQKVYDYFGFELRYNTDGVQTDENPNHRYSLFGYPVNINNDEKLAQIKNHNTREIVERLRPKIIRFSENNHIKTNKTDIENSLNQIMNLFPELRTEIGKKQHGAHNFELIKHSLKVLQKIVQTKGYEQLNEKDKKIIRYAALFHDITKTEGKVDKAHAQESAFDTYYIMKKMNLSKEEQIKLYSLVKNHEWLKSVNSASEEETEKARQSAAFDMQYDNLFEMSKILTEADLKSVKNNDNFYLQYEKEFKTHTKAIEDYIKELKKSQPVLPVTKFPKASTINNAINEVHSDGSTNIKGVYKNKDGLIIIRYNEVEDWEKIGFPPQSVSRGIQTENIDTGNIKFFVHGLDYSNQLAKFDAFALPDSDALLSVSYAERAESKYKFFRPQGIILDVDTKYVHGGGETDSGSGCSKNVDLFKKDYIFGGKRESDRLFISNLIKKTLNLNDEEYIEFVKNNSNKSIAEIEPKEAREKLVKEFAKINSRTRLGERAYNEMFISNPSRVMGVYAYSSDDDIGETLDFVDNQKDFLKQYALKNDLPFLVFGD